MATHTHVRMRRLVASGSALLIALALLAVWSSGMARVSAHSPHPGLNFTVSVPSVPGCTTAQGNAPCFMQPGTAFTVNVTLGALPADILSYEGFDILLSYAGVTSADNASTASWPDCAFPAIAYDTGLVNVACTIGVPPAGPSTYAGLVATDDFTCAQSGTISLAQGVGSTDLIEAAGTVHAELDGHDTLTISCGAPATPTPTRVPTPMPTPMPVLGSTGSAGTLSGGGGNGSAALWLAMAALLTVAGAGFVVFGRRFAHSR
jgi:hypothetical protein